MGLAISVTTDNEQKPSYTSATVLAAAFTLADADLTLWIGNAITLTKMEVVNAIRNCLAYIRENGSATPTGNNESYAQVATTMKKDVAGAFNSAILTALTGTVTVTIGTAAVVGVGTAFNTELVVGQSVDIGGEVHTVLTITDATNLTLATNHAAGAAGAAISLAAVPLETTVGIWYGPDFQQTAGASITPHVLRVIEKYLETVQKAA